MPDHRVDNVDLPRGWAGLRLSSPQLAATVLPGKGADIYQLEDVGTGVDVLFKTPWGLPPSTPSAPAQNAVTGFMERYPGGWQLLVPNGGDETKGPGGVRWGFHGEASVVPWELQAAGTATDDRGEHAYAQMSVQLHRAPLRIEREIRLANDTIGVDDEITNISPEPIEFMWSHHPAFGPPFLSPNCTIRHNARRFVADAEPGTLLAAGSEHDWPDVVTAGGEPIDLSRLPDAPAAQLGYLTGFDADVGQFEIHNPDLGLAVAARWPTSTFGCAWWWQELNCGSGYPWWKAAYVMAIEPASSFPGHGVHGVRESGGTLARLDGLGSHRAGMQLRVLNTGGDLPPAESIWRDQQ